MGHTRENFVLPEALQPTPHPLLPVPSGAELAALWGRPDGPALYSAWFNQRERLIRLAKEDPFRYEPELEVWQRADRLALEAGTTEVLALGGNRAGKSSWAAKRVVKALVEKPEAIAWCFHSTQETSINYQQPIVWKYLPLEWRQAKPTRVVDIRFSIKNGFTEAKFVGLNACQCLFKNYAQDPTTIEGGEIDIAWCDELVSIEVVKTLRFRLATRKGLLLITFTPVNGYSLTVKEFVEGARTVEWRRAGRRG